MRSTGRHVDRAVACRSLLDVFSNGNIGYSTASASSMGTGRQRSLTDTHFGLDMLNDVLVASARFYAERMGIAQDLVHLWRGEHAVGRNLSVVRESLRLLTPPSKEVIPRDERVSLVLDISASTCVAHTCSASSLPSFSYDSPVS